MGTSILVFCGINTCITTLYRVANESYNCSVVSAISTIVFDPMEGRHPDQIATRPGWTDTVIPAMRETHIINQSIYNISMVIGKVTLSTTPKRTGPRRSPEIMSNGIVQITMIRSSDVDVLRMLVADLISCPQYCGRNDFCRKRNPAFVQKQYLQGVIHLMSFWKAREPYSFFSWKIWLCPPH